MINQVTKPCTGRRSPAAALFATCLAICWLAIANIGVQAQVLVLKAHVEDTSGHPAKRGSVIFQDCLLNGDPAPSTACDSGSGAWSHIITLPVDQNGNALVDYGFVSHPRTIGFRFRYIGQGSSIANGASKSADVTWF